MYTQRNFLKDEVFLNIARENARLSKDQETKVGCVIVDSQGVIVSLGRNGTAKCINDKLVPFSRNNIPLEYHKVTYSSTELKFKRETIQIEQNKYFMMRHAEMNAISFADKDKLKGATIYCTHFPCPMCALDLVHNGIKEVVLPEENYLSGSSTEEDIQKTEYIFSLGDVKLFIGKTQIIYDNENYC